ncbi:MAG: SDR family NAD(P)-dependent oxidoreductase [Thermomicrobium sp.]|nr:SDR family oxidoreductase [Thermomicrobium sp.]MDW8059795.1 SDR family NAD(P)-dependent oxidoreductase [Thermomicrobium sp.]
MGRLTGLVALVTGAGGGELGGGGAGIARALAQEGAVVAVNDLAEEYAQATVEQITGQGGTAFVLAGDVSDPRRAQEMIETVVERYGRLDILVNNAARLGRSPAVERMSDEEWHSYIAVNLSGPFFMSRAALPHMMRQQYGRIVNIGSLAALRASLNGGAGYTASKRGLLGLTRQLAAEFYAYNITVNAVLPAGILSGRMRAEMGERAEALVAARRWALPDDIGKICAYLASPEAHLISAAVIVVPGANATGLGDFAQYRAMARQIGKDIGE